MASDALRAEQFEALLRRLGSDREAAGLRYEQLRRRLLVVFAYRGCLNAEELADLTMDRVARKIEDEGHGHEGADLGPFVLGVAWNIARESFRRPRLETLSDGADPADPVSPLDGPDTREREQACLDACLRRLAPDDRALVLSYFENDGRAKIAQRARLAGQLRISANALRLRIWRHTATLRQCVADCLHGQTAALAGDRLGSAAP